MKMKSKHFFGVVLLLLVLFMTGCSDDIGPRVINPPTQLIAFTEVGRVNLTWQAPEPGSNGRFNHYIIYRNGIAIGESKNEFYSDYTVLTGVTYAYYVVANFRFNNRDYNSEPSNIFDVVAVGIEFKPPRNLIGGGENSQVTLQWQAPEPGSQGVFRYYRIFKDAVFLQDTPNLSFSDTNVVIGNTYVYHVVATYLINNQSVDSDPSNSVLIVPNDRVFLPPRNLVATPLNNRVELQWEPPEPGSHGVLNQYRVYRDGEVIHTTQTLSFVDVTVENGVTYRYYVTASYIFENQIYNSMPSITAEVTPHVATFHPPRDLVAFDDGFRVNLQWLAPEAGSHGNLKIYKIFRNAVLYQETINTTYSDFDILPGSIYVYTVVANYDYNEENFDSVPTDPVTVTTPDPIFAPPKDLLGYGVDKAINLHWQAPDSGSSGVFLYYKIFRNSVVIDQTVDTVYTDTDVINDIAYNYYIVATYSYGLQSIDSIPSNTLTVAATPNTFNAPRNLVAFVGDEVVNLHWQAPLAGSHGDFVKYKVYRDGVVIYENSSLLYTDTNVVNGSLYNYYIVATYTFEGKDYDSAPSNTVPATPNEMIFNAPQSLLAFYESGQVNLHWQAPLEGSYGTFVKFKVFRNALVIQETTGFLHSDTNLGITGPGHYEFNYYIVATYVYNGQEFDSPPSNIQQIIIDVE